MQPVPHQRYRQYGAHSPHTGQPTPPEHYTACQYVYSDNGVPVRCTRRAILMPGYKRACADHVLHVLRESLAAFSQREASYYDDPHTRERVLELLKALTP